MNVFDPIKYFFIYFFNPEGRSKYKSFIALAKKIKQSKYSIFYNTYTREALPVLGVFFNDIYKCVLPMQRTLCKAEKSNILKEIIVSHFMHEKSREILKKISIEYIKEQSVMCKPDELFGMIKRTASNINKYFDESWRNVVDDVYRKIEAFSWFVNYDYPLIIRRFSGMARGDSAGQYKKTNAAGICEMLKDFVTVSKIIETRVQWQEIFAVLREFDPKFPPPDTWLKLHTQLSRLLKSEILIMIIQHAEENLDWKTQEIPSTGGFSKDYLDMLVAQAWEVLNTIQYEMKTGMIDKYIYRIFGENLAVNAHFYNETESDLLKRDGFKGFSQAKQFDYLYSFLHLYRESIREIVNAFLVKGAWVSREMSSDISQIMQILNERVNEIDVFDRSFSSNGMRGTKLHSYISKSTIGKRNSENLQKYLDTVNIEAEDIIARTLNSLAQLTDHLVHLELERSNTVQVLLHNWNEMESVLKDFMPLSECVQKLNDMITLINYIGSTEVSIDWHDAI